MLLYPKRGFEGLIIVLVCGLVCSCGIAPQPGKTRLAPTPVGISAGIPQPIGNLQRTDLSGDVPVFIVSSRNLLKDPEGVNPFGNERSGKEIPHLAIGRVSIGKGMDEEELRRETLEEIRRKKALVALEEVTVMPYPLHIDSWKVKKYYPEHQHDPWVQALRDQLDKGKTRRIAVFVHGFNTHLTTNTEKAAEIFHYMGRDGAVISFEWPSQGRMALTGYIRDKGNAEQSTRLFRGMIANLAIETDAKDITIIGHSAGSPIVVNSIRDLRLLEDNLTPTQLQEKYRINRVVLAAPDMDLMAFFNAVFDRFHDVSKGVAVYVSPDDKALKFSSKLFGNTQLGLSIGNLTDWEKEVLEGLQEIEMIDVSVPEAKFGSPLGHSYFHRNPWVSSDIGFFIHGARPKRRALIRTGNEIFWKFPRDYPEQLKALR